MGVLFGVAIGVAVGWLLPQPQWFARLVQKFTDGPTPRPD